MEILALDFSIVNKANRAMSETLIGVSSRVVRRAGGGYADAFGGGGLFYI